MPKSRPPAHFVGAGFPVGAPFNINWYEYVASWVIARFFTASQAVVQSFVVGRGYECLALPFLFACLTGMSSGGRALVPQGNPINNIMADSPRGGAK